MATGKITVRRCRVRGKTMHRVRRWENGKPKRTFFDSKDKADAEAANLKAQQDQAGAVWLSLPAAERNRLIAIYHEARNGGVDLHRAIALAKQSPSGDGPQISTVIEELRNSKLNNGADDGYVRNLLVVLNQFARGRESTPINRFTLADVEKFLESKSLEYRQTLRGRLSTLFNFAVRRGYRSDNPCARLESVKVTRPPTRILSVKKVRAAIEWLLEKQPQGLAWFALSTGCGLRPEEAEKTTKHDINFDEGYVRVEAQTTKVRQRRIVYPKKEAMAFLKWALSKGGKIPLSSNIRKEIIHNRHRKHGLRDELGFAAWPHDVTRHTAASYWLACEGETVKHVAKMLGHSEHICEGRYKAVSVDGKLLTYKEAKDFWAMLLKFASKRLKGEQPGLKGRRSNRFAHRGKTL